MKLKFSGFIGVGFALALPALAVAALQIPHTFQGGDVISAEQMNENFAAIKTAQPTPRTTLARLHEMGELSQPPLL